ncbi:MAG: MarR family transcriptional regulator [Burkholderiaceae bacterium]
MVRSIQFQHRSLSTPPAKLVDQALRQFVGYHLKRTYNVVRADLSRQLEPLGLRITTYSCLLLVIENPGVRQSELAQALDIERPNMVTILDELEKRGWITRERIPTDRRAYALTGTASGEQVCKQAVTVDKQHEARLLEKLNDKQVAKLIEALEKIESAQEDSSDDVA